MCHMCDSMGEGQIWYLNPKNYAHRMYRVKKTGEGQTEFRGGGAESQHEEGGAGENLLFKASEAKADGNMEIFNKLIKELNDRRAGRPSAQVLPLRDAEAVMDLVQGPLGAMMCTCRYLHRGEEANNLRDYSCLGIGTGMLKWERWPERYRGGVEFLSPAQAKEWLQYWDKRGYVHMLMQEGQSFIGGLCNCDYPTCGPIRNREDYGLYEHLVKAEYVAEVDYSLCNGCGDCVMRCQFGALRYEVALDKANLDPFKCFGCGLCETKCPRAAIKLVPRNSVPALIDVW